MQHWENQRARTGSARRPWRDRAIIPPRPDSPELVSGSNYGRSVRMVRLRDELYDEIRDRTVAIMRAAHCWANSEDEAMNAVVLHQCGEAQMACRVAHGEVYRVWH